MPPSAPIDSDVSGTTLYVLENTGLWAGSPVGTGDAVWTQLLDAATYTDLIDLSFSRVRVAGNTIYVVGGAGTGTATAYMFVSNSAGLTWNYYEIEADALTIRPYTVKTGFGAFSGPADSGYPTTDYLEFTIPRLESDDNEQSPWALAFDWTGSPPPSAPVGTAIPYVGGIDADATTYISENAGVNPQTSGGEVIGPVGMVNNLLSVGDQGVAEGFLDDYFGAGGVGGGAWQAVVNYFFLPDMPKDEVRNKFRMWLGGYSYPQAEVNVLVLAVGYVFYNVPEIVLPIALDYAPSNPQWVYVGSADKIYKSENGGVTWAELFTDAGANDIRVDPQLAGVFYTWRTTGSLEQIVAGAVNATLDTETPIRTPLRLARAANSGKLWALKSGTTLRLRNLGSWSDQQTGLLGATGLHAYLGDKLIFVDGGNIYVSDDGGTTITLKKGAWTGYGSGVNAHRLIV